MNKNLRQIGIKDESFELLKVSELIDRKLIERPIDGNHGETHPKGTDFVDFGVPFIMASDIKNGRINFDSCKYISEKQADSLRKGFAKNGDVLVTHKATIGETAIVDYGDHLYIMLTPQVTYYRIKDKSKINNCYLKFYFDSSLFQQTLAMWAGAGSTRAYLGITAQHNLPVILPQIEKQKKIAAILSAYDELIENNRRRVVLLENMAEEIYREWFVRFRFPGYKTTDFQKGIPKEWSMIKLEKAFKFLGGGTPSKDKDSYWKEGKVNWYTPSDITGANGIFLNESSEKPNEEGLKSCSAKIFPAYSIMMTSRATIGELAINRTEACTNQGFITCIPNKQYPLCYLFLWLKLNKNHFISLCGGATFPELNKGTFRRIEILTPSESVITQYQDLVYPLFNKIELLLLENENLIKAKNLLLPRLISGKLSVEKLEIQFPPSMLALNKN